MTQVDKILDITAEMDTSSFLRYLIGEKFPQKTVVTCSLRARSVVVLKLISEINPATPIVFCHMPNLFPESREYFTKLVSDLGLHDIREPVEDHGVLSGDCDHSEGLWAENPDDHTRAYMIAPLNEALAGFDCWISAAYHCPYPESPGPRVVQEGRLIRINPLASWSQSQVQSFMQEHGLSYHPLAMSGRSQPPKDESEVVTTFAF